MPKVSEEHRTARREQILAATLRCVAREGFHKTTMNAVIKESGLSAGAVYLYYRGKQDLIRALAAMAIGHITEAITGLAEAAEVVRPEEALAVATNRILEVGAELGVDLPPIILQVWAEAGRDSEIRQLVGTEAGRIRVAWTGYARRAVEAGRLAPDADVERVAESLMGMVPGFMVFRTVLGTELTPERYAKGLGELRRTAS